MANNNQKAQIHILKDQLGMSEDQYRSMLAGYGVSSSADDDFTEEMADDLIRTLRKEQRARQAKNSGQPHGWGKEKYEYLRPRPQNMADPKQLRKIEAIWRDVARNPSDEALANFLENHVGIRNIIWLEKPHAEAILCAEEAMSNYVPESGTSSDKDPETSSG